MLEHDVKKWGPLRAATADRPRLVRVLALIQELARVDDRALPDAAGIVVDRVAGAQLDLFILKTAGDAAAVGQADKLNRIWPTGSPLGFVLGEPPPSSADYFHGQAGMLDWMRAHWVDSPLLDWDWDDYSGAPLAILESAAVTLLPELFVAEMAVLDAIPSADRQARPAIGQHVAGLPEAAELWREHRELERAGNTAPTKTLATKYGCSKDTIGRRLKDGRPAVSSVFSIAR